MRVAALAAFEKACNDADVQCETSQITGVVTATIIENTELADLAVLGRGGEHTEWLDGLVGSTTEAVVRRAKCPVVVTATDSSQMDRLMVAYDGSTFGKKALQTGANLSESWKVPCDVLVVSAKKGDALVSEARAYMDAHDAEVEYITKEGDPSETIVSCASERGIDLLMIGAYGHTKVRELVVGSTTAYALNHAPCPLLLTR